MDFAARRSPFSVEESKQNAVNHFAKQGRLKYVPSIYGERKLSIQFIRSKVIERKRMVLRVLFAMYCVYENIFRVLFLTVCILPYRFCADILISARNRPGA